ncbi:MAG: hypothetical protein ACPGJV_10910 [Bacteriovoracaceae bacterium]
MSESVEIENIHEVLKVVDFNDFREWLCLQLEDITWQGRYTQEFEDFWEVFFVDDIQTSEMFERFDFVINSSKTGPLYSWFEWLREKFICYLFTYKDASVIRLSELSNLRLGHVASLLRSFFLERYPYLEEHLSHRFQVTYELSSNAYLTYSELSKELHIEKPDRGSHADEIMPCLEITLYEDWRTFLKKIKRQFKRVPGEESFDDHFSIWKGVFRTAGVILGLLVLCFLIFAGLKFFNERYEKIIKDKISIYEPKLQWLDKDITYREPISFTKTEGLGVDLENLDKPDENIEEREIIQRDGTESDVILTSWEGIEGDVEDVEAQRSAYEEGSKKGLRAYRYGRYKVYRVMLKSTDLFGSKASLNDILTQFSVEQAEQVKPGTIVPGGLYYNLFVPKGNTENFLSNVMKKRQGVLYESRTRTENPPGKDRVFIWVKSI